jgi:hypothetical protein
MRASHLVSASSLLAALFAFALPAAAMPQDYVVMGTPHVNLRTGPGTEYFVVGKAEKGDIFALAGQTDGWWEIRMFSGDIRYVSKDVRVYPLNKDQIVPGHNMTLPESAVRRRFIHQSVLMGVDRAAAEADELLPRDVDPARHENLRRISEDRILLETFHIYGLQPAMFDALLAREGQIGDSR